MWTWQCWLRAGRWPCLEPCGGGEDPAVLHRRPPQTDVQGTPGQSNRYRWTEENQFSVFFHPRAEPRVLICNCDTNFLINLNNNKIIINHQESKNIVGCIFGFLPSLILKICPFTSCCSISFSSC